MSSSWDLGAITSEWYLKPLVNRQTYYWGGLVAAEAGQSTTSNTQICTDAGDSWIPFIG